jgi:hypothetical protein
MYPRSHLFLLVFLLVGGMIFLGGCAAKTKSPSRPGFPDQPALSLARTLEQGMAEQPGKRAIAVTGGWGFGRDDAVILSLPSRSRTPYINTVPLESLVVRTHNEVEFSATPPDGQRYMVVDYGPVSRTLSAKQGRMYAVWRGRMVLVSEKKTPDLYQKVANLPLARRAAFVTRGQSLAVPREFWFDVTGTSTINADAAEQTAGRTPPAARGGTAAAAGNR